MDGTNLSIHNRVGSHRSAQVAGELMLLVAAVLSTAAKCDALAPPTQSPAPISVPAGTNFYTHPMRLGDEPCGKTTRDVPNVAPVKTETLPGGNSVIVNNGYSNTVIGDALNPDNSCGGGDEEGILWEQAQTVGLPGAGGLPG